MVELVGGPLDGQVLPSAPGDIPNLVWVKARRRHAGRCELLYRAVRSTDSERTVWIWSGDLITPCDCGTWHSRRDDGGALLTRCSLCGSELS